MECHVRSVLQIRGLAKSYKRVGSIFHDITFDLMEREILGIIGESACGKSTLLRILASVESPDTGEITVPTSTAGRKPVLVWQELALFEQMTVRENIEFGLKMLRTKPVDLKRRVDQCLLEFSLEDCEDRVVSSLSGGQRQRVALARALVVRPPILLLDEPFSSLDSILRDDMRRLIRCASEHSSIIVVSHDREDIYALADRVVVLDGHTVGQNGSIEMVFRNPATRFVAHFSGLFNEISSSLLCAVPIEHANEKKLIVRRSMVTRVCGPEPSPFMAKGKVLQVHTTQYERKTVVVQVGDKNPAAFVYYENDGTVPNMGDTVSLAWEENAVISGLC